MARSRRREHLLSLMLSLGTILICALGGELALRIMGQPFKGVPPSEFPLARFDPELGWSYVPGRAAEQSFGSDERKVAMYFDRYGSRVEAPGVERDPTRPSLLVVGCSYAMGHGVTAEESIAGQLANAPGQPFQVVNFAVQGFGTDQSLLMLERQIHVFHSKAAVYGFICDHLIRNANDDRRILFPEWRFLGTKPKFDLVDGRLLLSERPERYEDRFDSRLWGLMQVIQQRYAAEPSPELTRALLSEMKHVTDQEHVPLIVIDWEMEPTHPMCPDNMFDGLGLTVLHTQNGAPADWAKQMIPGDPHPNAANHHRVASLVLDELAGLGLATPHHL